MLRGTGSNFYISMECGAWGQNKAMIIGPINRRGFLRLGTTNEMNSFAAGRDADPVMRTTATWATGNKSRLSLSLGDGGDLC